MNHISVAMAVYNGEKFLMPQIESIMKQLGEKDELVVSLDPSKDRSEEIIRDLIKKDSRIRLLFGRGNGVIKNFENALRNCKNDIIFLADQDDIWLDGKVKKVMKIFENKKINVVMHDAIITDTDLKMIEPSFFAKKNSGTGILKNILSNTYIGCCMAFRRRVLCDALPFPERLPMHDQWIGLIGEMTGRNYLLREQLLKYRRHGGNVSGDHHSGIKQMIQWRFNLTCALLKVKLYRKR